MNILIKPDIIMIYLCCNRGFPQLMGYIKEWIVKNKREPVVQTFNVFNSYERGLLKKYQITQDELRLYSYVIDLSDNDKITKYPN